MFFGIFFDDFLLVPRSLPQSRLCMANDASFKSDTYSRETHVRKAANTHTALTPGEGRRAPQRFRVRV